MGRVWRLTAVLVFGGALALAACDPLCDECDSAVTVCHDGEGAFYPLEEGAWWRDRVLEYEVPDKVVSVCGPASAPALRPGVVAFPVLSESEKRWGLRWQEPITAGDGSGGCVRHVDEWFDWCGRGLEQEHYCPPATRIDARHVCVGERWTEDLRSTLVRVAADAPPGAWRDCWEQLRIHPDTCEPVGDVPAGCVVTINRERREWRVAAAHEPVSGPAGRFEALRVDYRATTEPIYSSTGSFPSTEPAVREKTFWWYRGTGKVKELTVAPDAAGEDETEGLFALCLPAEGCQERAPEYWELAPGGTVPPACDAPRTLSAACGPALFSAAAPE